MTTTAGKLLLVMSGGVDWRTIVAAHPEIIHWWSADGTLWQDSARTTPAVADGAPVGCIDDYISGGINALQATSGARPSLRLASNGLRYFATVSAQGWQSASGFSVFPSKRGCIFISFKNMNGTAIQTGLMGTFNQAGNTFYLYSTLGGGTNYKFYDGAQHNSSALDVVNTSYLQSFHRTADTSLSFYRNGTLADTITVQNLQQAADVDYFPGSFIQVDFIGMIRDVIITSDITDAKRIQIENFLLGRLPPALGGAPRIVGFGDSVTAGTGASDAAHRWLNIVAASVNSAYTLVNSGVGSTVLQNTTQNTVAVIGGASAGNGQDNLTARVLNNIPSWVFVLYGVNDLRLNDAAFTTTTFQNSLTAVVTSMLAIGLDPARIVLGSPQYTDPAVDGSNAPFDAGSTAKHEAYRDVVAAVAAAKGVKYADIYQYMLDNGANTLLEAGGIHPNDAGHAAIATKFLSVL